MAPQLKKAVEMRKKQLIQRLIQLGIYKKRRAPPLRIVFKRTRKRIPIQQERRIIMSKRKIKTFHQLVEEYKKEIAKNPKEMEVIYDKIDRRHENRLLAMSKAKQT